MRILSELLSEDKSANNELEEMIANSTNNISFKKGDISKGEENLLKFQVTTNSYLGVVIYSYSSITVENGLIRIFGTGNDIERNIVDWNSKIEGTSSIIVADDIFGGSFSINRGDLGENIGLIYYFSPRHLEWLDLGASYSEFLGWCLLGDIKDFYSEYDLENYAPLLKNIETNEGLSIVPFLWSKEYQSEKKKVKTVPIKELVELNFDFQKKFGL